jgi:signal peptidase II
LRVLVVIVSVFVVLVDQVAKFFVRSRFKNSGKLSLIDGLLDVVYIENRGAAFGIFSGARWFFVIFTVLVIFCFTIFVFKKPIKILTFYLSSSLIIGGGFSNLIDRIWLGYVIDYLELSFFSPVCNLADYCITLGTVLFVASLMVSRHKIYGRQGV